MTGPGKEHQGPEPPSSGELPAEAEAAWADAELDAEAFPEVRAQVGALPRLKPPAHFVAQVMAQVVALEDERAAAGEAAPPPAAEVSPSAAAGSPQQAPAGAESPDAAEAEALDPAEAEALERVAALVQGLPRLPAPPNFVARVLRAVEEVEEERLREALEAGRARVLWWGRFAGLARAACFLLVVAGGAYLGTPDAEKLAWIDPSARIATPPSGFDDDRVRPQPREQSSALEPVTLHAPPPYDGTWELSAPGSFSGAHAATVSLMQRYGQLEASLNDADEGDYVVNVPAQQVDDLHRELDRAESVQVNERSYRSADELHAEGDRVLLKNGFVLVGRLLRDKGGGIRLRCGGMVHRIPAEDVERVETADAQRRIRLRLHRQGE